MEVLTQLLQTKPEVLVLILLLVFLTILVILAIFIAIFTRRQALTQLLADPAIRSRLQDQDTDLAALLQAIVQQAIELDRVNNQQLPWYQKMFHDITWDVPGLIGIAVTLALLVMVMSRSTESVPKEIFAGWAMILGFYFGKAAR
jgi:hypothetical protein